MSYEIIVVGAGHAGIEAACAASGMGCRTLLVTLSGESIGRLSCNPAIGGVGKGQLVKEIDALGGQMARAADACGIHFRVLNASKGAAVQSSRAQIDMRMYSGYIRRLVLNRPNLSVREAEVESIITSQGEAQGVTIAGGEEIKARCVVISPGTFLDGLMHIGRKQTAGGRTGEPAVVRLTRNFRELGFELLRFKTGTCPRIDSNSIDFSDLIAQEADEVPRPFSFSSSKPLCKQIACHITYTNKDTHRIILENLQDSPLYGSGAIKSTGVRYCPSIEDKAVKFSDKERHQVFLEPQGLDTNEVYPNGLSTSLPEDVQLKMLRSIKGLEQVKVLRFGYGIEHTVVEPTQVYPSLETKPVKNLYLAGQVNGTTGYEEAASQGLIAGINAVLRAKGKRPFILDRASSYIGVLIDDLTTRGTAEPYRMFTSRVEYRLVLREDNADLRLSKFGYELGLLDKEAYAQVERKSEEIKKARTFLKKSCLKPNKELNSRLERIGTAPIKKPVSLEGLLKRPEMNIGRLAEIIECVIAGGGSGAIASEAKQSHNRNNKIASPPFGLLAMTAGSREPHNDGVIESALRQAEIEVKYAGFIQRQLKDIERFEHLEKIRIPADIDYAGISGLSREAQEKLNKFKPINLGQASRISGVTPAAVSLLMVYIRKL